MREADFEVLLRLWSSGSAGSSGRRSGAPWRPRLASPRRPGCWRRPSPRPPRCPHCAEAAPPRRWGHASGPRRHRCKTCRKTFNALTGTSLARLREKERWLAYGEALAAGMSLTEAAAHCGVHLTTSFRWRHRFVPASTGGDARGAGRRGRGGRDLLSALR
jgi:transposase-like protein